MAKCTYISGLLVVLGDVGVVVQAEHLGARQRRQRAHVLQHARVLHVARHHVLPARGERVANGLYRGFVIVHILSNYLQ